MNTPKLSLTDDQWTILMCILIPEMESLITDPCSEQRKIGRKLGTIITKFRKYRHDTNQ